MIAQTDQITTKEKPIASLTTYRNDERKLSIEEVSAGLRVGDESVLGYVYSQHVHDLYRFGNQIIQNKEMVKDCIQNVFAGLVKNKKSLDGISSIKSYLFKSLYREIMDQAKKDRKYFLGHPALENQKGFEIDLSCESRMIADDHQRSMMHKIKEELSKLSKKQKKAILLYYYEGMSQGEVAELMSLKDKNSVTKLIRRGLDVLRQNIILVVTLLSCL